MIMMGMIWIRMMAMSITVSEYFSVSRSMQNANTAKYYFDGSILFCKIILGN